VLWLALCLLFLLGGKFMHDERKFPNEKTSAISPWAHSPIAVLFLPAEDPLIGLNPSEQDPTAFKLSLDTSTGPANAADLFRPPLFKPCRTTGRVDFVLPCSAYYELCQARAPPRVSNLIVS
jgi:hypothetical protein